VTDDERHPVVGKALGRRQDLLQTIGRLEAALTAPTARTGWRDDVQRELEAVKQAFHDHLEVTEGEEGLFDDVVQAAPRLAHQVDVLRAEHDEIEETIDEALAFSGDAGEMREAVMALMARLVRHRQRGADLLYEAYDVDVSVGD
jgi:hypothetical protein